MYALQYQELLLKTNATLATYATPYIRSGISQLTSLVTKLQLEKGSGAASALAIGTLTAETVKWVWSKGSSSKTQRIANQLLALGIAAAGTYFASGAAAASPVPFNLIAIAMGSVLFFCKQGKKNQLAEKEVALGKKETLLGERETQLANKETRVTRDRENLAQVKRSDHELYVLCVNHLSKREKELQWKIDQNGQREIGLAEREKQLQLEARRVESDARWLDIRNSVVAKPKLDIAVDIPTVPYVKIQASSTETKKMFNESRNVLTATLEKLCKEQADQIAKENAKVERRAVILAQRAEKKAEVEKQEAAVAFERKKMEQAELEQYFERRARCDLVRLQKLVTMYNNCFVDLKNRMGDYQRDPVAGKYYLENLKYHLENITLWIKNTETALQGYIRQGIAVKHQLDEIKSKLKHDLAIESNFQRAMELSTRWNVIEPKIASLKARLQLLRLQQALDLKAKNSLDQPVAILQNFESAQAKRRLADHIQDLDKLELKGRNRVLSASTDDQRLALEGELVYSRDQVKKLPQRIAGAERELEQLLKEAVTLRGEFEAIGVK